jgi:hypothetical protein
MAASSGGGHRSLPQQLVDAFWREENRPEPKETSYIVWCAYLALAGNIDGTL